MNAVIVSGLFVGLIYALFGVGLVISYRGSRIINFAHAETGMLGAFFYSEFRFGAEGAAFGTDRGLWLALPLGIAIAAALGALTEVLVVRPLRHAPRIRPLVGTFAVGTLFFVYAVRRWGLDPHPSGALVHGDGIRFAGLTIVPGQMLILVVSVVVMVGLWAIYRYTAFGLRLRATAIDPGAAGLVGVDINRTSMATWALAGAVGGLSAILIAPLVSFNTAFMTTLAVRGLAAALLGGLSNIGGTFGAGIVIGVAEALLAYQSPVTGVTDVALSALLLVVLILRPTGLLRSAY